MLNKDNTCPSQQGPALTCISLPSSIFPFSAPPPTVTVVGLLGIIPALSDYGYCVGSWDMWKCCIPCLREPPLLPAWQSMALVTPGREQRGPPHRCRWARPEGTDAGAVRACQSHRQCSPPAFPDLFLHGMLFSLPKTRSTGVVLTTWEPGVRALPRSLPTAILKHTGAFQVGKLPC